MGTKRTKVYATLLILVLGSISGCRKDVTAPNDGQICTMIDGVLVCVP